MSQVNEPEDSASEESLKAVAVHGAMKVYLDFTAAILKTQAWAAWLRCIELQVQAGNLNFQVQGICAVFNSSSTARGGQAAG
jgi:hypothetical protein